MDLYREGDRVFVRVVDYKSGTHKFGLDEVRSGMDIQLVLYLFATLAADPDRYRPAGAQYLYASSEKGKTAISRSGFLLDNDSVRIAADCSPDKRYTKKLLLQTEEELQALNADMRTAVCAVAERILAGEAQKTPSQDACLFCPIRAHCDRAYHG